MRPSHSLLFLSTILLYLTVFTAAWPWPVDKFLPAVDSLIVRDAFIKRADDKSASATDQQTSAASQTASASTAAKTSATDSKSDDNSKTTAAASASGTDASASGSSASESGTKDSSDTKSDKKTKTTSTSTISVASDAPAGGIDLLIPDTTSGSSFYKISDWVTFAWNYTSLSVTPTAIDVYVTCTSNSQMYTITQNMTVPDNATGAVLWDTNDYPEKTNAPLLTAVYTMYIFDADSAISAEASPGHLSVFDYSFGMYTKSPYTPLSGWVCPDCSAALSPDERRYLGFMLGMATITVLSFTWFVSGLGVVW